MLSGALFLICLFSLTLAVPPHPQLLEDIESGRIIAPYYVEHINELHKKGVCSDKRFINKDFGKSNSQQSKQSVPSFRVLAILVKFSDHKNSVSASAVESLIFGSTGSSVHNYFSDISYGQLDMVTLDLPSSMGWLTAPQSYSYYTDGRNGLGSYPNNSQKLVEDMVDQLDSQVDFSNYDNDGDGYVDVLLVVHSGIGGEKSGSGNDIWSHKWSIIPRLKDNVYISDYTVQPEYLVEPGDMTIGVFAHELCHGFGLPDLYDLDQSSRGIGKWGLMSNGCWNGPYPGGSHPANPCAWARIEMGFVTPINVTSIQNDLAINEVSESGEIYRLWTCGEETNEYFLIENRQKVGYDSYLPGSGLVIWHIDENKGANTQEWYPGLSGQFHYKVAFEQADGDFDLEHGANFGDASDPFPGSSGNRSFSATSSPNSNAYTSGITSVEIRNITESNGVIYADITSGTFFDTDHNGVGDACTGCCLGQRGDVNGDGKNADLLDLSFLVDLIFRQSGYPLECYEESDVNADLKGPNILDLNYLASYIFRFGPNPPLCGD